MNILITGGTGFIGSRLALRYLSQGDSVIILAEENNDAEADNRKIIEAAGAKIVIGSVIDDEKVKQIVHGMDYVYHFAAIQHQMNVPDKKFRDVNVRGTKNILEASINAGIKRLLYGSTIGVYGTALDGNVNEDSSVEPDNIYGKTKLEAEKMVLYYKNKLPVVAIRISETYGPGDRRLLKLFKTIKKGRFFMVGKGDNIHHLIYVEDLIDGFLQAIRSEAALGKVFVLSGKQALTTNEMTRIIASCLKSNLLPFRAPLSLFLFIATVMELTLRPLGIQPPLHRRRMDFFKKSFSFSQEQAKKVLGFNPKIDFQEGAALSATWYQENGYL